MHIDWSPSPPLGERVGVRGESELPAGQNPLRLQTPMEGPDGEDFTYIHGCEQEVQTCE
jgi:hypothetical protein